MRQTESRNIGWAVGNLIWRPVGTGLPVARDRIKIPLGTDCVRNGGKEEHERAAERCRDKSFHRVIPGQHRGASDRTQVVSRRENRMELAAACQPRIVKGTRSGLPTRIATVSVSSCAPMKC